jgi:hypothetical protein
VVIARVFRDDDVLGRNEEMIIPNLGTKCVVIRRLGTCLQSSSRSVSMPFV